jgi:hypothetical protein
MTHNPFIPCKFGYITYPTYIPEVAVYIGMLRRLFTYNINKAVDRFKRGDKADYVDIQGVLGELIFAHHLFTSNVPHTPNKLLGNRPFSGADFTVSGVNIDVKTVTEGKDFLLVNKEAHLKAKNIHRYVFIKPLSISSAAFWSFNYNDINAWPVVDAGYTPAYKLIADNMPDDCRTFLIIKADN